METQSNQTNDFPDEVWEIINVVVLRIIKRKGQEHLKDDYISEASLAIASVYPPKNGLSLEWKEEATRIAYNACNNFVRRQIGRDDSVSGALRKATTSLDKPIGEDGELLDLVFDERTDLELPPPEPRNFLAWAATVRAEVFNAVEKQDVSDMMKAVVKKAKGGDLDAVRLLMDYVLGGKMRSMRGLGERDA